MYGGTGGTADGARVGVGVLGAGVPLPKFRLDRVLRLDTATFGGTGAVDVDQFCRFFMYCASFVDPGAGPYLDCDTVWLSCAVVMFWNGFDASI